MTCDEFKEMVKRRPRECTRGERSAVAQHAHTCPTCENHLFGIIPKAFRNPLGSLVFSILAGRNLEDIAAGREMAYADRLDPEFTKTTLDDKMEKD